MRQRNGVNTGIQIKHKTITLFLIIFCNCAIADNKSSSIGGEFSTTYTTNQYEKDDHRSLRSFNWSGTISQKLSERYSTYISSGGYRGYEDETGDFLTDTVIGLADSNLATIGMTGKLKHNIQVTLPTSEQSKKDDLYSAIRLAIIYSDSSKELDYYISPRIRKNFHKYKTAGGKSLEEWVGSLSIGAKYKWLDYTIEASLLGGTLWTYQNTRRDWKYSGSLSGTWDITKNLYTSLSLSNSGVYFDAEKGTIGDIDLFNERTASYSLSIGFRF